MLGKIFISHFVLFYLLNHLYLVFIANPYFWPRKYPSWDLLMQAGVNTGSFDLFALAEICSILLNKQ